MATRNASSSGSAVALCLLTLWLGSCASPRLRLPEGPGVPLTDYHELFEAAVDDCRRVRTLEAMLAIRGRRGDTALRGRVRSAFAEPASLRLEGLTPFGGPAFVLIVGDQSPLLLLSRERRVITDATGRDLLDVLAGLDLGPSDFRSVVTGCLVPDPRPHAARRYANDWIGVDLEGDATLYLQQVDGAPIVVAGRRRGLVVEYGDHTRGLPRHLRLQTTSPAVVGTDLTASMSQVSINVELDPRVFDPVIPDGFTPMSIDALRDTPGPLEDARGSDP